MVLLIRETNYNKRIEIQTAFGSGVELGQTYCLN